VHKTELIELLNYAELAACISVIGVIFLRKQFADYRALAFFLIARASSTIALMTIMWKASSYNGTSHAAKTAYLIYFDVYWASYAIEALLGIGIIWSVYRLAMAPLKGLQSLGMLMFRWAAAIAVVVAIGMSLGPNVTTNQFIIHAVTQLQQTQAILTLCLLLFVTFAIRPMGLSYRSKIFGVSFGLGIMAMMGLVNAAWAPHSRSMMSVVNIVNGVAILAAMLIWTAYFALPEPKRRIIVLPTTSPFLRWNQISEALGDDPGYVAVGGIHPEIFAPAELEVMRRASVKMIMEPIAVGAE
jgi:hypothetical protein